jgi:phosphoglycolate phosphatase
MFDLDGTLVDTLEDITRCVNACLIAMGDPPRSRSEVMGMVGDGIDALCRRALGRPEPDRVEEMKERARAYYREHPAETAAPYPGVPGMLDVLRTRGMKLAVLSNKPHAMVEDLMSRLFPESLFEVLLGQCEDLPPKPDPAGALRVARVLGVEASALLFVGDSEVDIQTGKAAGMPVAGVTWGFRTAAQLRAAGAAILVDRPVELLQVAQDIRAA